MKRNKIILLIDDDREFHQICKQCVEDAGYFFQSALNANQGLEILENSQIDLAIMNYQLPDMSGRDFFNLSKSKQGNTSCNLPFILVTENQLSPTLANELLGMGIELCLSKPFGIQELLNVIENVLINNVIHYQTKKQANDNQLIIEKLSQENQQLRSQIKQNYNFENIIGTTPVMLEILEKIHKIAKTDANVFISGENGTGKELIARSIHANSRRNDRAFVVFDCKALPAHLLEIELFGVDHEPNLNITGPKIGNLQLANQGTIFFDEICGLNHDLQAKLLRTIQEKQFRLCSSNKVCDADVRIISASTCVPEKAVSEDQLREDLYYRLNVIPIKLPPLRERKADIPLLVAHFLNRMNLNNGEQPAEFSQEAMRMLKNYHWPGNVRELQNVVERVISLAGNSLVNAEDLPDHILHNSELHSFLPSPELPLKEARKKWMEKFERNYLVELLTRCNGNISEVARVAQSNRMTVYRMIKNYNISTRKFAKK